MKAPLVECPCCHGTGRAPLTTPLTDTLAVLTAKPVSTAAIHAAVPGSQYFGITAVNNRLTKLEAMGFATKERRGREFFWRTAK